MKNSFFKKLLVFLLLFIMIPLIGLDKPYKRLDKLHATGIGAHLMSFYETVSKTCEGQKIHYKGDTSLGTLLKFKVHQDGMKVKVEEVEFQDAKDNKITFKTVRTLFTVNPVKGKLYCFEGVLPDGIADKRMTIEYRGKKISYYLHNSLNHVLVEGKDGPEPMELDTIEFYSGDEGDKY
ncbi:hypothetical protein [Leptotrichia sp. oral taxon 223]|uniref:hypothetical protein n=1 Tax=Leptotrichia sp. oral taxon 223 TaxID=712363 RepID=UPI0015B9D953|nr:hypothetical protein [Leptotrichia sp. oral taxon 223]NWO18619.1 hypothetical protein [Leptotrichia sp. oral taxon 223]